MNGADAGYMARALRLAERGVYGASPNPRVGCVLVAAGQIVGEGWHARAGGAHAEIAALQAAAGRAQGATAYVTLEPCNHHGRTGPCAEALLAAGVARVVYAAGDEGEQSAGGAAHLRAAGLDVAGGLLADSAVALNPGFHRRCRGGLPWVRVKLAQSLDGRTALSNGESRWITGPHARADVHLWRARSCAVLTGIGTVLADDPQLTARTPQAQRQPIRVVLDSRGRMPPDARIRDGQAPTLVFHAGAPSGDPRLAWPDATGRVELYRVLEDLGGRGLNEIWVEAGATLAGAFLKAGLVDELLIYTAPCLLGAGRPLLQLPELQDLSRRQQLDILEHRRIGADWRIRARPLGRAPEAEPAMASDA